MRSHISWTAIGRSALVLGMLLLAGCSTETLFETNFNATPVGQPPAANQQTGTAAVFGPEGSVVVVGGVDQTSTRWVRIGRADRQAQIAGMQGTVSVSRGPGQYTFMCVMFMPSGSGLATLQFEPFGQSVDSLTSFLHLDFTTDNQVRIDDNETTKFGTFPRDHPFNVIVNLDTAASPPTAHISLLGTGASGSVDYTILPPFRGMAQQFGAVRVWMGFPWTGTFDTTELLILHRL